MPRRLVIEGWRGTSHSYAIVNQQQLIHLAKDPRLELFHVDVPLFHPGWRAIGDGFAPDVRRAIDSIGPPAGGVVPDAIYRISYPLRIYPIQGVRVYVYGTSEFGALRPIDVCGPSGTARDVNSHDVHIVTPSTWSKTGFLASGIADDQVHVLPHGFEPREFSGLEHDARERTRAALGIPGDAFVFLHVGAMGWNKGVGPMLAGFALHRRKNPQSYLVLKGADSLYGNQMSQSLAEANQIAPGAWREDVEEGYRYIGGNLSRHQLAQLYCMSDAYLSAYRAEGFGLPVLEALGAGLPVIVTRGGATDDFCPDRFALKIHALRRDLEHGQHYLEPAIESIVDCMQRMIDDSALRDRAAKEAAAWAAANHSWESASRRLADLLCAG